MWRKKFQDQKSNHWSIWLLDHRAWKLHQHESEFSMITQSEWCAITDSLFKNLTRCRKSGDISSHNIEHFMNWRFKITVKWIPVYVWFVCLRGDLFVQRRRCYKRYNLRNADVVLQHCQCCKLQLKHVTRCNVSAQPHWTFSATRKTVFKLLSNTVANTDLSLSEFC